jgi:hypothetical protein
MPLYEVLDDSKLAEPALIAGLNGWVDAGLAGTTAAAYIAQAGELVVRFDVDALIDYRARRPTLEIRDGVLTSLAWTELTIKRVRTERRDLLVLTGPEPDYRWLAFREAIVELAGRLGITESVCLGAIGATVPHTHATPLLITGADRGQLESDLPLPSGAMQVPASALNIIEIYLAELGIRSVGMWAQVPHYVDGAYFAGALALVERAADHLGVVLSTAPLVDLVREQRARLDAIVAQRPDAQAYLDQLEANERAGGAAPPGEDIASELERFLREATGDDKNPFEGPPDEATPGE